MHTTTPHTPHPHSLNLFIKAKPRLLFLHLLSAACVSGAVGGDHVVEPYHSAGHEGQGVGAWRAARRRRAKVQLLFVRHLHRGSQAQWTCAWERAAWRAVWTCAPGRGRHGVRCWCDVRWCAVRRSVACLSRRQPKAVTAPCFLPNAPSSSSFPPPSAPPHRDL